MVYIILLLLALGFAIPTFGLSLLVFFIFTSYLNKVAAKPIMVAMYTSYRTSSEITLPHRDYSTVRKAFRMLDVRDFEEQYFSALGLRTFTGYVAHPQHKNRLLVQIHCHRVPNERPYLTIESSDTAAGAEEWLEELMARGAGQG